MKANIPSNIAAFIAAATVLAAFLIINFTGIYWVGPYAWDDGAITLAYAKTLAEHGRFALTGASDISEGSSSLLFVLLMSALHRVFAFNFENFILASQAAAFFATCAVMILVYRQLALSIPNPFYRAIVAGLLGTLPMFTAEILNGMEMSVFAFLLAAAAVAYQSKSGLIYWLIPLLLLVRFETIFYLLFSFTGLLVMDKTQRSYLAKLTGFTLLVFCCISLFRFTFFGDIIPNTVRAKMHPPYSPADMPGKVFLRALGLMEFFFVHSYLLFFSATLLLWQRKTGLLLPAFKWLLILSFGIFSMVTGKNWSYDGRMFLPCLPLFILAMNDVLGYCAAKQWLALMVMTLALAGTHYGNLALFKANVQTATDGGHYQERLSNRLENLPGIRLKNPGIWYGVTPQNYRITGLAVENLRKVLGLQNITFMAPDVGGLGLCCDNIRVIDSGMLTNPSLANRGYENFNEYLKNMSPDVIETHDIWSEVSGIYQSPFFTDNYKPVICDNNLFWLRSDLDNRLASLPNVQHSHIPLLALRSSVRYADAVVDYLNLQSRAVDTVSTISTGAFTNQNGK